MPLQVGRTRGRGLKRHGEHHCTGAGRTPSREESCRLFPGMRDPAVIRRKASGHLKPGSAGGEFVLVCE